MKSSIGVYSSSSLSKASQNKCVQCLCVVSCLWIICWPLYCMCNKNMDNKIIARYQIGMSIQQFQQTVSQIVPPFIHARTQNVTIQI